MCTDGNVDPVPANNGLVAFWALLVAPGEARFAEIQKG
jgi:hypothetical protein